MTADQIIEDIKLLPRDEQSRVVQFAVELARSRQLPAEDLVVIAQKMLETNELLHFHYFSDSRCCMAILNTS